MANNYGNNYLATEETPQQRYERELQEWEARTYESEMHKAMSKPNPPNYFRANND